MKKFFRVLMLAGAFGATVVWSMGAAGPGEKSKGATAKQAATTECQGHEPGGSPECQRKHATGECQGHEPGQPHGKEGGQQHQSNQGSQAKK